VTRLPWPFLRIVDESGAGSGFAAIEGPLRTPVDVARFESMRRSSRFIGFTSYARFPARHPRYARLCEAWCHCFRDPDAFLPPGRERTLLSISDFVDYTAIAPEQIDPTWDGRKTIDFVYVCREDRWSERVKNWPLARRCLPVLSRRLGLEGVLVGRESLAGVPRGAQPRVTGELPFRRLMRLVLRARFVFFPNELDASPRLIAEALSLGTPVLVNRRILGGWKYVNRYTGEFFDGADDVAAAALRCLERPRATRAWFAANHGPLQASERLRRLIARLDPATGARRLLLTRVA
jgi:glycosyltransferase involved in cell wall biosynthesis